MAAREASAWNRRANSRPDVPETITIPAPAALVRRNRRRSIPFGVGWSSLVLVIERGNASRNHRSIRAPAPAPSSAGRASTGRASGLVADAMTPTRPRTASPMYPTSGRRTAATPTSAATIARTTPIPASNTVLSLEPNVRIAKLFNHSGVRSMAAPPTATIGEASGSKIPATSCATPIATPPQSSPTTTPAPTFRSRAGAGSDVAGGAIVRAMRPGCDTDVARPLRPDPLSGHDIDRTSRPAAGRVRPRIARLTQWLGQASSSIASALGSETSATSVSGSSWASSSASLPDSARSCSRRRSDSRPGSSSSGSAAISRLRPSAKGPRSVRHTSRARGPSRWWWVSAA